MIAESRSFERYTFRVTGTLAVKVSRSVVAVGTQTYPDMVVVGGFPAFSHSLNLKHSSDVLMHLVVLLQQSNNLSTLMVVLVKVKFHLQGCPSM